MNPDENIMMKKMLQKMANYIASSKKYNDFEIVDVFFAFGSKHRSAMCDWVYGIKIYTKVPIVPPADAYTVYTQKEIQGPSIRYTTRDEKVREFQMDIKKLTDKQFGQSVCCTDVIFEKS